MLGLPFAVGGGPLLTTTGQLELPKSASICTASANPTCVTIVGSMRGTSVPSATSL